MGIFPILLVIATLLCGLLAGFVFAYAVVIMPGLRNLNDREFIRGFQVTDQIIQNNQPLFMLMWVGSVIALIATAVVGLSRLEGFDLYLMLGATLAYVLGVQVSTIAINLPLNNRLQTVNVDAASAEELREARAAFELRWNRANVSRTIIATAVTASLLVLLVRL